MRRKQGYRHAPSREGILLWIIAGRDAGAGGKPLKKDGPLVLSEHGAIVHNPANRAACWPSSLLEWLTPVERPSAILRLPPIDNRLSILRGGA
jgi:hypothetical protein